MDIKNEAQRAAKRIRKYVRETPLVSSPSLSKKAKSNIYLKLESEQVTGSFKVRGVFNKLLSLSKSEREKGVITASTGNHGRAVAYGLKRLQMKGKIYLPKNVAKNKLEAIESYGIPIEIYGRECLEAEVRAKEEAEKIEATYISPYNDEDVVAGQGTIGVEILKQLPEVDSILVPVGGSGMIAGIGGYSKSVNPKIEIIGCLPENSPVMAESIKAGRIVEVKIKETISDATAGGVEENSITFPLCQKYVDEFLLVNEEEIKEAIYLINKKHHKIIEGAAALTVATLLKHRERFADKKVVLVLSGSNISTDKLKEILGSY